MSRTAADPKTGLTTKQETFCVELVKSGNASEAYRKAYDSSGMKAETISRTAFELQSKPKIAARIEQLRAEVRRKGLVTLEEHLKALGVLRNKAAEARQYSAAISAEIARGKVSGLYADVGFDEDAPPVNRVEITIKDGRKLA